MTKMKYQKDIWHLKNISSTIIFPPIRGPFKAIFLWLQVLARNTELSHFVRFDFSGSGGRSPAGFHVH